MSACECVRIETESKGVKPFPFFNVQWVNERLKAFVDAFERAMFARMMAASDADDEADKLVAVFKRELRHHPHGGRSYDPKDEERAKVYMEKADMQITPLAMIGDVVAFTFLFGVSQFCAGAKHTLTAPKRKELIYKVDELDRRIREALPLKAVPQTGTSVGNCTLLILRRCVVKQWPRLNPLRQSMAHVCNQAHDLTVFRCEAYPVFNHLSWIKAQSQPPSCDPAMLQKTQAAIRTTHHTAGYAFDSERFPRVGEYYGAFGVQHRTTDGRYNWPSMAQCGDALSRTVYLTTVSYFSHIANPEVLKGWSGWARPTTEHLRALVAECLSPQYSATWPSVNSKTGEIVLAIPLRGGKANIATLCQGTIGVQLMLLQACLSLGRTSLSSDAFKASLTVPGQLKFDLGWAYTQRAPDRPPADAVLLTRFLLACCLGDLENNPIRCHGFVIGNLATLAATAQALRLPEIEAMIAAHIDVTRDCFAQSNPKKWLILAHILESECGVKQPAEPWHDLPDIVAKCHSKPVAQASTSSTSPSTDQKHPFAPAGDDDDFIHRLPVLMACRKSSSGAVLLRAKEEEKTHVPKLPVAKRKARRAPGASRSTEHKHCSTAVTTNEAVLQEEVKRRADLEALNKKLSEVLAPCVGCGKDVTADTASVCAECTSGCKLMYHDGPCSRPMSKAILAARKSQTVPCFKDHCQGELLTVWRKATDGRKQFLMDTRRRTQRRPAHTVTINAPYEEKTRIRRHAEGKAEGTVRSTDSKTDPVAVGTRHGREKARSDTGTASKRRNARRARRAHMHFNPLPAVGAPGSKYGTTTPNDTVQTTFDDVPRRTSPTLTMPCMPVDTKHVKNTTSSTNADQNFHNAERPGVPVEPRGRSLVPLPSDKAAVSQQTAIGHAASDPTGERKSRRKQRRQRQKLPLDLFLQAVGEDTRKSQWTPPPKPISTGIIDQHVDTAVDVGQQIEGH